MAELPPLETRCPPWTLATGGCQRAAPEARRLDHMERSSRCADPHYRGHIGASPGPNGTRVAPARSVRTAARVAAGPGRERGSRPRPRAPADPAAQLVPGTPRLGKVPPSLRHGHNLKTKWYHIDCMFVNFTRASRKSKTITDLADVEHLDSLSAPDRRRVAELIDAHAAERGIGRRKARKLRDASDDDGSPPPPKRSRASSSASALDAGKITSILSSLASGDEVKRRRPARRRPGPWVARRLFRTADLLLHVLRARRPTAPPSAGESAVAANALLEIFGAARAVSTTSSEDDDGAAAPPRT
ncbi:MgtC-like protein [Aureococcus anophagefferens]|nr:MgtC-like protein [Aureococcus anophagefferens]